MASCSIFIYELSGIEKTSIDDIYNRIKEYPEDEISYFNLELISNTELLGDYVMVQSVEEKYYDTSTRSFEKRVISKANVLSFTLIDNRLEIWGNKTNANKLIFVLSNILDNISINAVEICLKEMIPKLMKHRIKVSKVCFEDFLFTEDIVGNFTVDLSSYGDSFSVLQKYQDKISRMTIILPCGDGVLKMSLTSKGRIVVYRTRNDFDEETMLLLHDIIQK